MTLLDILFPASAGKRMKLADLDRELKEMTVLSPDEREYMKATFSKYLANGISKLEAEQAIRGLRLNFKDNLDQNEVEKVKRKLLAFFV
jgi:hypothetical protein